MEALANDLAFELDGAVDDSQTTFDVVSAAGAPAVPFRIRVDDEFMLVTNIASLTFTVTRECEDSTRFPAAAHASGAEAHCVVTVEGAREIGATTRRVITQATHGFTAGQLLYHNGTSYVVADKDDAATAEVIGIVEASVDTNTFVLVTGGYINTLSGLTAGTVYFLGDAGALTATEPSTVGQITKPVLVAVSTTAGYFINMRGAMVGGPSTNLLVERFSGDGSDTTFTLGSSPMEENTFVMVEGVYQQKDTYSISGTTLTFSVAPPAGTNNIEVVTIGSVGIGVPSDNTVSTAKLVDGAVTGAKVAPGATLALATKQASTSGTAINFTSIPSGTKQITVTFAKVSLSGTSSLLVQLGTSGGYTTTGYSGFAGWSDGGGGSAFSSNGMLVSIGAAGSHMTGTVTWTLMDAATNLWVGTMVAVYNNGSDAGYAHFGATSIALAAELDRVRITTVNGTDTFDLGNINIAYK